MIHNPRLDLLFVHIQKTAGTSIHDALMREPGSTSIKPHHMRLRDVRLSGRKPRVVAVVRNPWERLVSWYRMMVRKGVHNDFSAYLLAPVGEGGGPVDFSTFIRRTGEVSETSRDERGRYRLTGVGRKWSAPYLKSIGWNQEDFLTVEGVFKADEVLRFERLEEEWEALGHRCLPGTGWSIPLPRANSAPAGGHVSWREEYANGHDVDFVARQFARDIDRFGYRFED